MITTGAVYRLNRYRALLSSKTLLTTVCTTFMFYLMYTIARKVFFLDNGEGASDEPRIHGYIYLDESFPRSPLPFCGTPLGWENIDSEVRSKERDISRVVR